ncbi:MAG: hypothetical protein HYX48_05785 [Chlamydiales bacterium]|nr:hypothetical protein [Chlamydiales bacterium]
MSNIQGPGKPDHHDIQMYAQEYKRGIDLFQRALIEYNSADEVHKKDAFREVMDRALQVLNETAQGMKRDDLVAQNQKIAQDFQTYQNSHSPKDEKVLEKDLNQARRAL